MPRIPDYVAQVGAPDIGQTPSANNGGQAVGAGLQALGGGLQDVGGAVIDVDKANAYRLQERQQKQTAFDDNAKWDLYRAQSANALKEAAGNMPAEATGFAQSFMQTQAQPQADLLAGISPVNRAKYQKLLAVENEQTLGSASQMEHAGRAAYETTTVNNAFESYLKGITLNPAARDAAQADLFQKIDSTSSLDEATKNDMKQKALQGISQAQWQALYGSDPKAGAAAFGRHLPGDTGGGEPNVLLAAVAKGESGGDYDKIFANGKWGAPPQPLTSMTLDQAIGLANSIRKNPDNPHNAGPVGKYQFVGSTLQGLKGQMGLSGNEQFTPQMQDAMAWRNLENTGGDPEKIRQQWTSWAGKSDAEIKQLWSQGLVQHQQFVAGGGNGPTGGPAAAGASRLTSTGYAAGASPQPLTPDPRFSSLTLDQQNSLIASSQRTFDEQQANTAKQQKLFTDNQENQLQNALQDGNAGMPEISQARQAGWLVDADKVAKFEEIVAKRDKGVQNVKGFFDTLNSGGRLNPYSTDDQDKADAAFKSLGGDMAALDTVFQTGIMPKSGAVALRGALVSNDATQVQKALTIATNALQQNPNAFTGVEGGNDIEQKAQTFDHLVNSRGMPMSQAVAQIQQSGTPEYKSKIRVADDQVKDFQKAITPDTIAPMFASVSQGSLSNPRGTPALGADPGQQAEMLRDFREAATEYYKQTGDADLAQKMAKGDLDKVWGVTNFLGTPVLAKFPVEKTYPPVNADPAGPYAYVERQAVDAIRDQTGRLVLPQNIVIAAQMPAAAQAYYKGQPAPYTVGYTAPDPNGFPVVHTLPGNFFPDPAKGHALASQQIAPAIDAQSTRDATRQQMNDQLQQLQRGMMGDIVHPENNMPSANAPATVPVIKPPSTPAATVPGKPAATPTGNDAFQQLKNQVEGGGTGGDGFGGSGVGM